ncbi:hypothetical protein ACWGOQ_0023245 [Aquimarina sp. M1]
MKNQKIKRFIPVFLFLSIPMFITSCYDDFSGGVYQHIETKKHLLNVLKDFAISEKEKDADAHRDLFLSSSSSVNFVLKNNGNPNLVSLSRDQWIGFFTSWDYEYFAEYSDVKFYIEDGIALDSHHFQGVRDGIDDLYGNDIFLYVKTPAGWKIVTLSSTIVAPDDTTDYSVVPIIEESPEQLLFDFEEYYNQQKESEFKSLFLSELTSCFIVDEVFEDTYSDEVHSVNGFFNEVIAGQKIVFSHTKTKIKDQFTGVISSSYKIIDETGQIIEKGKMLSALAGTPNNGWKIAGMVFSVHP